MTEPNTDPVSVLGYHPRWVESGFLDAATLQRQLQAFARGDDRHTEHYRYATFCDVLGLRSPLDDRALEQYVELAQLDPDPSMARSALVTLLHRGGLSDAQLEWLASHPAFQFRVGRQHMLRVRLLRVLEAGEFTEANLRTALDAHDAVVQCALLEKGGVATEQLKALSREGATRAVRNVATVQLRRR